MTFYETILVWITLTHERPGEFLEFHDEACSPSMGTPLLQPITLRNNEVPLKKSGSSRGINLNKGGIYAILNNCHNGRKGPVGYFSDQR